VGTLNLLVVVAHKESCRLNVFYLLLEKLNGFADGKYDVSSVLGSQITQDYEAKRTDASDVIENLNIVKRIISVCMSCFLFCGHDRYKCLYSQTRPSVAGQLYRSGIVNRTLC
jgi:hypothetical protein